MVVSPSSGYMRQAAASVPQHLGALSKHRNRAPNLRNPPAWAACRDWEVSEMMVSI
jgi:hypothetical protein